MERRASRGGVHGGCAAADAALRDEGARETGAEAKVLADVTPRSAAWLPLPLLLESDEEWAWPRRRSSGMGRRGAGACSVIMARAMWSWRGRGLVRCKCGTEVRRVWAWLGEARDGGGVGMYRDGETDERRMWWSRGRPQSQSGKVGQAGRRWAEERTRLAQQRPCGCLQLRA